MNSLHAAADLCSVLFRVRPFLAFIGAPLFSAVVLASGQEAKPLPSASQRVKVPAAPARVHGPARVDPRSVVNFRGRGGIVYSTGLAPVSVRMMHRLPHDGRDKRSPYVGQIYALIGGKKFHLGSNYENKTARLGMLPAGEMTIIVENASERFTAATGPAERNADGLRHATVRELPDGVVEVHMEMSRGLTEERLIYGNADAQGYARANYLADVHLYFSGGVTGDLTVPMLLESLKDPNPEVRKTAAEALRQSHPEIARSAGLLGGGGARRSPAQPGPGSK